MKEKRFSFRTNEEDFYELRFGALDGFVFEDGMSDNELMNLALWLNRLIEADRNTLRGDKITGTKDPNTCVHGTLAAVDSGWKCTRCGTGLPLNAADEGEFEKRREERGSIMTPAQTAILARARTAPNGFSTSWVRQSTGLTTPQAYRVLRQLAAKGLVRQDRHPGQWRPVMDVAA